MGQTKNPSVPASCSHRGQADASGKAKRTARTESHLVCATQQLAHGGRWSLVSRVKYRRHYEKPTHSLIHLEKERPSPSQTLDSVFSWGSSCFLFSWCARRCVPGVSVNWMTSAMWYDELFIASSTIQVVSPGAPGVLKADTQNNHFTRGLLICLLALRCLSCQRKQSSVCLESNLSGRERPWVRAHRFTYGSNFASQRSDPFCQGKAATVGLKQASCRNVRSI